MGGWNGGRPSLDCSPVTRLKSRQGRCLMSHLSPGHLRLNLSLKDDLLKPLSFPCSKHFRCPKADEQQLLFLEEGVFLQETQIRLVDWDLRVLVSLLYDTGNCLTFLHLFCVTQLITLAIPLPRGLDVNMTI